MTGIYVSFGIFTLSILGIWSVQKMINRRVARLKKNMPAPFKVGLPPFAGRIFPASQVYPSTFVVMEDFSDVKLWGDDAILSFGVYDLDYVYPSLLLKAWRPDTKTPGVFELAAKKKRFPKSWHRGYAPNNISLCGDEVVVEPRIKDESIGTGWQGLLAFVGFTAFVAGVLFVIEKFFHILR